MSAWIGISSKVMLLELTETDADVAEAVADVRLATGYGELEQALFFNLPLSPIIWSALSVCDRNNPDELL